MCRVCVYMYVYMYDVCGYSYALLMDVGYYIMDVCNVVISLKGIHEIHVHCSCLESYLCFIVYLQYYIYHSSLSVPYIMFTYNSQA